MPSAAARRLARERPRLHAPRTSSHDLANVRGQRSPAPTTCSYMTFPAL